MLYPQDGPQGGFISHENRGVNIGMDGFHILEPYTGFQHGGMTGMDKEGYPIPFAGYKLSEDLVGVMVTDSEGKRVPIATFGAINEAGTKCGVGTTASGQIGTFDTYHKVGSNAGVVGIAWNMVTVPDQMEVFYNGNLIGYTYNPGNPSTPALVSGQGCIYVNYNPVGSDYQLMVRLTSNEDGTVWNYIVNCSTGVCNFKQPNAGNTSYKIPFGGNCCAGASADRNQTHFPTDAPNPLTDPNPDCHYSFVVCGCKARRRSGKMYREKVTVVSITKPPGYVLQAYTMYNYDPARTYCTTPPVYGFNSCLAGTGYDPAYIHMPLQTIAVNDVLWDYTSEGPGCETPNHNIFFRLCRPFVNGINLGLQGTIVLKCEIEEV